MNDYETPQTDEQLRETASDREAHYFLGTKLEPFSAARSCAFERVRFAEGDIEVSASIVFLCTLDAKRCRNIRGAEAIDKFREELEEWMDANGITLGMEPDPERAGLRRYSSPSTRAVIDVADAIWTEKEAAAFKIKSSGSPESPN